MESIDPKVNNLSKVICVIVTFDGIRWIRNCLQSVLKSEYPVEIIIVDNGSTDGTLSVIADFFPEARVIRAPENLGFGKGNNLGIRLAIENGARYIFLLNQDAYIYPDSIANLIEAFNRNASAGLISPVHLAGDERNLDFGFYKYADPALTPLLLGDVMRGKFSFDYDTEFVNAAAWMLKLEAIKTIGMFHPAFDHYGEDREYVNRLKANGYRVMINVNSFIIHDRKQDRKGNHFHAYGHKLRREMLQGLIEKKISWGEVSYRLSKAFIVNVITLKFLRAAAIIRHGIWLASKRTLLDKSERIK